jgi:hypothetical protein
LRCLAFDCIVVGVVVDHRMEGLVVGHHLVRQRYCVVIRERYALCSTKPVCLRYHSFHQNGHCCDQRRRGLMVESRIQSRHQERLLHRMCTPGICWKYS